MTQRKYPLPPSRDGTKQIAASYDPSISDALRMLAIKEKKSSKALIFEALEMLFKSRNIDIYKILEEEKKKKEREQKL